jgi:hypothetical protein
MEFEDYVSSWVAGVAAMMQLKLKPKDMAKWRAEMTNMWRIGYLGCVSDLRIFRFESKGKRPHLYADSPTLRRVPLCKRQQFDPTTSASSLAKLKGDECATCKRQFRKLGQRGALRPA